MSLDWETTKNSHTVAVRAANLSRQNDTEQEFAARSEDRDRRFHASTRCARRDTSGTSPLKKREFVNVRRSLPPPAVSNSRPEWRMDNLQRLTVGLYRQRCPHADDTSCTSA